MTKPMARLCSVQGRVLFGVYLMLRGDQSGTVRVGDPVLIDSIGTE
jgi:hypothetical protein